jgi:hypothetical protein
MNVPTVSCLCGDVVLSAQGAPLRAGISHCMDCQNIMVRPSMPLRSFGKTRSISWVQHAVTKDGISVRAAGPLSLRKAMKLSKSILAQWIILSISSRPTKDGPSGAPNGYPPLRVQRSTRKDATIGAALTKPFLPLLTGGSKDAHSALQKPADRRDALLQQSRRLLAQQSGPRPQSSIGGAR